MILEERVVAAWQKAFDVREAVSGKNASTNNPFAKTLAALKTLCQEENLPMAIIGGVARAFYGYAPTTNDVDVVVSIADHAKIIGVCQKYGFRIMPDAPGGIHVLDFAGIPVEVFQEGMAFGGEANYTVPAPKELGVTAGLGYSSLPGWVAMKMARSKLKDEVDVIEVAKTRTPAEIEQLRLHFKANSPALSSQLDRLLGLAEEEKRNWIAITSSRHVSTAISHNHVGGL